MSDEDTGFDEWGIVDVMGHQRYYGRITEHVIAGKGFVRIDVPEDPEDPKFAPFSKLIGTASIYAITPMEESAVRSLAARNRQTPIESWKLSEALQPRIPDRDAMEF